MTLRAPAHRRDSATACGSPRPPVRRCDARPSDGHAASRRRFRSCARRSQRRASWTQTAARSAIPSEERAETYGRCRTRTCGHLRVRQPGPLCAVAGFPAENTSEQAFLRVLALSFLPTKAPFCAPVVGCMWDGVVRFSVNRQRFRTFGCICVSAPRGFRGAVARAERGEAHARARRATTSSRSRAGSTTTTRVAASRRGSGRAAAPPSSGSSGVVEDGELGTLLRGVNPATARALRKPVRERTITVEQLDLATGEWREERKSARAGRRLRPRLLLPEERQPPARAQRRRARAPRDQRGARAAWQAALGYLEGEACVVRRGNGGASASTAGVRRGRVPAPHLPGAGPAPAHARDRRQHGPRRGRRVAGARRRGDPEDLPARRRLPLRGPATARATRTLGRRVGRSRSKGMAELERRARGSDSRVLDAAAQSLRRAHGGARHRGLRRRPRGRARDARGEGAGRPAAAARGLAGPRRRARPRPARSSKRLGRERPRSSRSLRSSRALAARLFGPEGLTAKQTDVLDAGARAWPVAGLAAGRRADRAGARAGGRAFAGFPGVELARAAATRRAGRRASRPRSCSQIERRRARARARRPRRRTRRARTATLARDARWSRARGSRASSGCSCTRPRRARTASSASSVPPARARRPRCASLADAYQRGRRPGARRCPERSRGRRARSRDRHPELDAPPAPARRASARAASRTAACSSSTRPAWPRRASSRPSSSSSTRRRGRRSWSATRTSSPPSAPAACSPRSASGSARSSSTRTAASATCSSARALARLREGDPDAYLAYAASQGRLHSSDDPTTRSSGCSRTGGRPPEHDLARQRDARLPSRRRRATSTRPRARCSRATAASAATSARAPADASFASVTASSAAATTARSASATAPAAPSSTSSPTQLTLRTDTGTLRSAPARLRRRAPRARLRAHRPRRPGRHRRARLRPPQRPRERSANGATSPSHAPAPRHASTSRSATRSSGKRRSAIQVPRPARTRRPGPRTLSRRTARARPESKATRPENEDPRPATGATRRTTRAHGRAADSRPAGAKDPPLVEPRQSSRARKPSRTRPIRAPACRSETRPTSPTRSTATAVPRALSRAGRSGAVVATGADAAAPGTRTRPRARAVSSRRPRTRCGSQTQRVSARVSGEEDIPFRTSATATPAHLVWTALLRFGPERPGAAPPRPIQSVAPSRLRSD